MCGAHYVNVGIIGHGLHCFCGTMQSGRTYCGRSARHALHHGALQRTERPELNSDLQVLAVLEVSRSHPDNFSMEMHGRAEASWLNGHHDPVTLLQEPLCIDLRAAGADIHKFRDIPAFPQEEEPFRVDNHAELFLHSRVFPTFFRIHRAVPEGLFVTSHK